MADVPACGATLAAEFIFGQTVVGDCDLRRGHRGDHEVDSNNGRIHWPQFLVPKGWRDYAC